MQRLNHRKQNVALRVGARSFGSATRAGLWARVFILLGLLLPHEASARTLTLLGIRNAAAPVARFLARDAESAFTYESLSLLEVALTPKGTTRWTTLLSAAQALKHQHAGVSDLHRVLLERKESEARDNSELLGFQKAEEIACYSVQVEAKKPPVHLDTTGKEHGYAWTCVLASGTTPTARLLLEVQRNATMIHFAPDNQRPVIRIAQVPHLQVEIPRRGPRALPVISLSKAYRIPHADQQRFIYLLVFQRSLPLVANLAPREVLILLHPDALQKPDGGLVTKGSADPLLWAFQ